MANLQIQPAAKPIVKLAAKLIHTYVHVYPDNT